MFGLTTVAHADIFGPHTQTYQVYNPRLGEPLAIEPSTIFTIITDAVNYLGSREGTVYDFKRKEWVTFTGATFYTTHNFSFDIGMLNLDGVGAGVDYNLGAWLPTKGIPVLHYTQYLYVGGGCGARYDSDKSTWQVAPYVGAEFKLVF